MYGDRSGVLGFSWFCFALPPGMKLAQFRGKSKLSHSSVDVPTFQEFMLCFLFCRCDHCVII